MTTLTNTTATETAIQMVIMDAIEKGHTVISEMAEYMKSEVFATAVSNYKRMLETI
jgi:hypothetical protein